METNMLRCVVWGLGPGAGSGKEDGTLKGTIQDIQGLYQRSIGICRDHVGVTCGLLMGMEKEWKLLFNI